MTDGKLAVIGLGSIGSMALWQASRLSDSVTGFEAASPAHGRSAVGGDTRLFRMLYRGNRLKTPPDSAKSPHTKPSANDLLRAWHSPGANASTNPPGLRLLR